MWINQQNMSWGGTWFEFIQLGNPVQPCHGLQDRFDLQRVHLKSVSQLKDGHSLGFAGTGAVELL